MSSLRTALERAKKLQQAASQSRDATARAAEAAAVKGGARAGSEGLISIGALRRVPANEETIKGNRILTRGMRGPAEVAYRMLRTRLMQKMRANGWRILGVSSISQNEGKTFTAINLAISIAAEVDQEAVLVDLDLRRPSIHTYLGIETREFTGLPKYLRGGVQELRNLLICPGIDRLGCLLSAEPLEQPSDLLASAYGKRLFDELRGRLAPNVVVIVDLPPLLAVDDALAVAPMLDGLLLVVAEGQARRDDIAEARPLLQEFNLIGTLLNKSVEKDSKRQYYY